MCPQCFARSSGARNSPEDKEGLFQAHFGSEENLLEPPYSVIYCFLFGNPKRCCKSQRWVLISNFPERFLNPYLCSKLVSEVFIGCVAVWASIPHLCLHHQEELNVMFKCLNWLNLSLQPKKIPKGYFFQAKTAGVWPITRSTQQMASKIWESRIWAGPCQAGSAAAGLSEVELWLQGSQAP